MLSIQFMKKMDSVVRLHNNNTYPDICMEKNWDGAVCRSKLLNQGSETVRLKEAVLFTSALQLDPNIKLYGEGYSKLSQYGGTLGHPVDIGHYNDHKHYKIPQPKGFWVVYNLALLSPESSHHILLAFSSCRRFNGEFRFGNGSLEIVLDLEGLQLEPGQSWELEEFLYLEGANEEELMDQLSERLKLHHPPLLAPEIPTGWCSWYGYGPSVTEQDILNNMKVISEKVQGLTYIQIDDGYQAAMGDWLKPQESFVDMKALCLRIKENGFEPAMWVAPFIAEANSDLFRDHPEWFIHDDHGAPLPSDRVSFGGWRSGPWYMLDGTHPGAKEYLTHVFKTMREEWECKYFKLDAIMWGALHGGCRYDGSKTRIEGYRAGMEAILKGAGDDSFILGCNAPMWPSIGTVHGMRVGHDIAHNWQRFSNVARECFHRNWQHNRLWINDPDCVLLENSLVQQVDPSGNVTTIKTPLTHDEFMFHRTFIYATGGMVLSGDDLTSMSEHNLAMLRKLLPPTNVPARFDDRTFRIGRIDAGDRLMFCIFNWEDRPDTFEINLPFACDVRDYWTDEPLGLYSDRLILKDIPPHAARLLSCYKVVGVS